jgi:hypothetical protein
MGSMNSIKNIIYFVTCSLLMGSVLAFKSTKNGKNSAPATQKTREKRTCWTVKEDQKLFKAVNQKKIKNWLQVSKLVPKRNSK